MEGLHPRPLEIDLDVSIGVVSELLALPEEADQHHKLKLGRERRNKQGVEAGVLDARRYPGIDGAKLVDFYVSVLDDESERTETRMQAAAWLADRGFGKAPDVQRQEGEDPLGLNDAKGRLAAKLAPPMDIAQPYARQRDGGSQPG